MTTALVARRALLDYARRPLNVVLLIAVPAVIVSALGGELANFSRLLSATAKPTHLQVATSGWAAAGVAGLAGFFQVVGSRSTDRRLAASSVRGANPVVAGRLVAAAGLAVAAAAAALSALAVRGDVADLPRAAGATLMVAIIYVAIGALVGTLVRSEMNGALVVSTIWMLDVFVGSGLGGSSSMLARFFPLHFPTMMLTSQAAHHGGPIGDVGWSLIWATMLTIFAVARLASTTRPVPRAHVTSRAGTVSTAPPSTTTTIVRTTAESTAPHLRSLTVERRRWVPRSPLMAGLQAAVREYRRDRVLWVLLVAVPVLFIALAAQETPTTLMPVSIIHGARHVTTMISLRHVHAAEMASVASALLAGVAGLFVVTGSAAGDQRLVLAGFSPRQVLIGHLGVVAGAAAITSAVSLAVSAAFFSPQQWVPYAGADLLIAVTYAMIGVLLGPLTGRLGGLYLILTLAMVDVGFGQTVMFHPLPPNWGEYLPARGAGRLLLEGAFGSGSTQIANLALGLGWVVALSAAAAFTFRARTGVSLARTTINERSS